MESRLSLDSVFVNRQHLWLSSKQCFLFFPLPQGAVWYSSTGCRHQWLFRFPTEAKSFFRRLKTYASRFHQLFFYRVRMRGLGYRVRRITTSLYRFYFTRTNYIYFHLPDKLWLFLRKRRMLFVSRHKDLLQQVIKHVLKLHAASPYNKRGFTFPRYLRRKKPGKKVL